MLPESITTILDTSWANIVIRLLIVVVVLLITRMIRRQMQMIIAFFVRRAFRALTRLLPENTDLDERVINALLPPFRLVVSVFGWWLASLVLNLPPNVNTVIVLFRDALLTIAIFWIIHRFINVTVDYTRRRPQRGALLSDTVLLFGRQLAQALLWILAFTAILGQFGYNVSAILAGLGLGGLAVALAAQDVFTNLIGYFVIIMDSPFRVGEYVISDKGAGFVESISFRSTRLRSPDRPLLIIPNKDITSGSVTNWSRASMLTGAGSRVYNHTIHLELDTPPDKIIAVIESIRSMLVDHPQAKRETILVNLTEISENALCVQVVCDFGVPAWNEYQALKQEVNLNILTILQQHAVLLSQSMSNVAVQVKR